MKTKTLGLILALCLLSGSACFANAFTGTWKLNPAKSKLRHAGQRNDWVVYEWAFPNQTKVSVTGVDGKGKRMHTDWVGRFDGKDYAVTGATDEDTRAYTEVNDHTLNFASKKGGKVLQKGRVVVAADGKSRTVTTWHKQGKKTVTNVAVYDKA